MDNEYLRDWNHEILCNIAKFYLSFTNTQKIQAYGENYIFSFVCIEFSKFGIRPENVATFWIYKTNAFPDPNSDHPV